MKIDFCRIRVYALGSAEECRSKDQQGDIGGFLPPEDDSDISF